MVENQSPSSCSSPGEVTPAGDISYAVSAKRAPGALLTRETWVMGGACHKATGNWIRKNEQQSVLKSEKHQWPTESFLLLLCLRDTLEEKNDVKKKIFYLSIQLSSSVVRWDEGRGRWSREGHWRVAGTVVPEQVTSERTPPLSLSPT